MEGRPCLTGGSGPQWWGAEEETLDRALVAGLMLEAALAGPALPSDPQARRAAVKTRLQKSLVSLLAGRITLDRFRALIRTLEGCFSFYFPLISPLLRPGEAPVSKGVILPGEAGPFASCRPVLSDLLADALNRLQGVLPRRPHSKLTRAKLQDFLGRTRGGWFRLGDFQEHFAIDRKTAWEYVHKLLRAGLLVHNSSRAAAVRYALAERFLTVQSGALRGEVAAVLKDLPARLASQVADGLIASSGEPFWEEDWGRVLPQAQVQEIVRRFTMPGSLLEVVLSPDGKNRLMRLRPRWLQP